jgi:hypothetical protein
MAAEIGQSHLRLQSNAVFQEQGSVHSTDPFVLTELGVQVGNGLPRFIVNGNHLSSAI